MKLAQIEMAKEIEALREANEDASEALRVTKEDLEKLHAQHAALPSVSTFSSTADKTPRQGSAVEEEEDDSAAQSSSNDTLEILGRVARVALKEEDFLGLPQSVVVRLVQRGVTGPQLQVLFVCRDSGQVLARLMEDVLNMKGFEFKTLVDEVTALKLIEPGHGGQFEITVGGRQVLKAALKQLKLAPVPYQER